MKSVRRLCITLTTVNSGYASKVLAVAADVTAAPDKWLKARRHCLSTLKFGINLNFRCIRCVRHNSKVGRIVAYAMAVI